LSYRSHDFRVHAGFYFQASIYELHSNHGFQKQALFWNRVQARLGKSSVAARTANRSSTRIKEWTMLKILAIGTMAAVAVTLGASQRSAATGTKDVVDTTVAAGSFKTLAKALEAAGLVQTLKGSGPFTVFAPTDEAFAKLPAGTLETLLKPENKAQLQRILSCHVVAGRVLAADVVKLHAAKAISGDTISIVVNNGGVMVGDAHVVKTDIAATNGVIHVIDAVMIPDHE
jgi:uncharacterized surface protein with fasciclin (FAS1) repeats